MHAGVAVDYFLIFSMVENSTLLSLFVNIYRVGAMMRVRER
jgi:hypothetical protein